MKPTVLCVDDDSKEHQEYLNLLGPLYNIVEAYNSRDAREMLKAMTIDVILMDFQLGMENGVLVTGKLKEEGFTQPVLIVSRNHPGDKTAELARTEYGAYDFVIKDPEIYKPVLEAMIKELV